MLARTVAMEEPLGVEAGWFPEALTHVHPYPLGRFGWLT